MSPLDDPHTNGDCLQLRVVAAGPGKVTFDLHIHKQHTVRNKKETEILVHTGRARDADASLEPVEHFARRNNR